MASDNPFDIFLPPGPGSQQPDPPDLDNERTQSNRSAHTSSTQFHSANTIRPTQSTAFRFTESEALSYRQEFGSQVTFTPPRPHIRSPTSMTLQQFASLSSNQGTMILERLDSISNNMANLTSAIGTLIARFDDNSNTAKKSPLSAVTPLDGLSSRDLLPCDPWPPRRR